ncbi:unnamed protein product [Absidia cylindrospora]
MHKSTSEYSFTSKWSHFVSKHSHHTNSNEYRRPSQCSDQSVSSTSSSSSSSSTWDRWLGRFKHHRRRGSSGQSSRSILLEEQEEDKKDDQQRLDQLYQTALDDLSYAEDSHGSRYYAGDVASAKEALDSCAKALLDIMMTDQHSTSHLYTTMAPRLLLLQSRFDALPSLHH